LLLLDDPAEEFGARSIMDLLRHSWYENSRLAATSSGFNFKAGLFADARKPKSTRSLCGLRSPQPLSKTDALGV
jgi:hypothetical protein